MKTLLKRFVCFLCIVTLLPITAFGEGYDSEPLYRSNFRLGFSLEPKAFPNDGNIHYSDWQAFLSAMKIAGTIDYQRPEQPDDQYVRMNADIILDDKSYFPFRYESFGYSRFFIPLKCPFAFIYFNMANFWEFMVKPFIFMDLPTNLISMGLYWEQTRWVLKSFLEPIQKALEGKNSLSYDEVFTLAEKLSDQICYDDFSRYYYFLYGFLGLIYGNSLIYDDLCYLTDWVDFLDPEKKGLTITISGSQKNFRLGDHLLFTTDGKSWNFSVPDPNGYMFHMSKEHQSNALCFTVKAYLGEEERLNVSFFINGLPDENTLENDGTISFTARGGALQDSLEMDQFDLQFAFQHTRSSLLLPRSEIFQLQWIHPETQLPALGMWYDAVIEQISTTEITNEDLILNERSYDFFSLNDQKLILFKETILPNFVFVLLPLVLRIPLGIFSDVYGFVKDTGFLAMLGFEGVQ